MIPVELSKAADADLVRILDYGAETFGEEAAAAYVAGFETTFALIATHPFAGAIHDEVHPPIRSPPHGSHRIYHDLLEGRAVVQRILHKAMDRQRHL